MPRARPSRSFKSFSTASFSLAFWKAVAKNLAEPSGSSPALKPPGNMMIWAWLIAFSNTSTESTMSAASMFLNTLVITFAPAFSNAFALSYSQLVPGKTGMNTVGCAILWLQICTLEAWKQPSSLSSPSSFFSDFTNQLVGPSWAPDRVANTFSRVPVHALSASSRPMTASP